MNRNLAAAALALLSLPLAGCGGGGGSNVASTPVPPSPPSPPPPPPPTPPPPDLFATNANRTFSNLGTTADFPLLEAYYDGTFTGPGTTFGAFSALTARPDGHLGITNLNSSALGITDLPLTPYPGVRASGPGVRDVSGEIRSSSLDYTRYGWWMASAITEGMIAGAPFVGGFATPTAAVPTTGTATYSGTATGIYDRDWICNCNDMPGMFTGNVSLTANFSASTLGGSITDIVVMDYLGFQAGPMNDIGFNASVNRTTGFFSGTTSVLNQPAGNYVFSNAAAGNIFGRFYGPSAQEVGAVFGLSDGTKRLVGSFGAKAN